MDEDENWLHGERIECPTCHQLLYRVDHSPFYDEHFLYCDRCPIHVEVSYYDPVYKHIHEHVRQRFSHDEENDYIALMHAIEVRLKPCRCGGSFRHDAPRRCLTCHTPVIIDDPLDIDLFRWHAAFDPNAVDMTEEAVEEEECWMSQFVRTKDIWRVDPG